MYFCETQYGSVGKKKILALQWGDGVNFGSKLCNVIYECPLMALPKEFGQCSGKHQTYANRLLNEM